MPGQSGVAWFPEKQTVEGRGTTAAVLAIGRNLSQRSHGLTGRYRIMASILDAGQDADQQIRTPVHWPDARHLSTAQKAGAAATVGSDVAAGEHPAVGFP